MTPVAFPRARVTATRSEAGVQRWHITYLQAPGQEVQADVTRYWPTAGHAATEARRNGLNTIARLLDRHEYEIPTFNAARGVLP